MSGILVGEGSANYMHTCIGARPALLIKRHWLQSQNCFHITVTLAYVFWADRIMPSGLTTPSPLWSLCSTNVEEVFVNTTSAVLQFSPHCHCSMLVCVSEFEPLCVFFLKCWGFWFFGGESWKAGKSSEKTYSGCKRNMTVFKISIKFCGF